MTLQRIRDLHSGGATLREIAATLNQEGHKPRRSSEWQASTLGSILKRMEKAT